MLSEAVPMNFQRRRPRQPSDTLRRALLDLAGNQGTITDHKERSWASITFAGTRHQLELVFEGAEAVETGERFITNLPEHLFDIPGQLVADAAVISVDHQMGDAPSMRISTEVLLLNDE